jgi:hypothetical protein
VNHIVDARELGRPHLKGIRQRQTLYEIRGLREPAVAVPAAT